VTKVLYVEDNDDDVYMLKMRLEDELGALAANVNKMCEELGRLYGQIEMASQHAQWRFVVDVQRRRDDRSR
jgi:nitrate/nitrite-specific signal transduction histidine kinase